MFIFHALHCIDNKHDSPYIVKWAKSLHVLQSQHLTFLIWLKNLYAKITILKYDLYNAHSPQQHSYIVTSTLCSPPWLRLDLPSASATLVSCPVAPNSCTQ